MFKISTILSFAYKRLKFHVGRYVVEIGGDIERYGSFLASDVAYLQVFSRHRKISRIGYFTPEINNTSIVSENSSCLGDVQIKAYSTIGYNAVLRGDCATIR